MVNFRMYLKKYPVLMLFFATGSVVDAAELVFPQAVYQVEVAQTQEKLRNGLMNVLSLPEKTGMLFDLRPYEGQEPAMWMKDTYIPLDMLFLDCGFKVVDVYQNAEPLSLEKIRSSHPFCYVLEINGGESERFHLSIGQTAVLKPQP